MRYYIMAAAIGLAAASAWANVNIANPGFDYDDPDHFDYNVSGWTFTYGYTEYTENELPVGDSNYRFMSFYPENGDLNDPSPSSVAYLREYFYEPANIPPEEGGGSEEGGATITDSANYELRLTSDPFTIGEDGLYSIGMNLWTIGPDSESDYFIAVLKNTSDAFQVTYAIWDNHIESEDDIVTQYTGQYWNSVNAAVNAGTYTLTFILQADNQLEEESSVGMDNIQVLKYEPGDPGAIVPTPSALVLALTGLAVVRRRRAA